jgi:polyphosphate kinase
MTVLTNVETASRTRHARGSPLVPAGARFLNRELSWLDFNRRVLQLASDHDLPLLERVKLLAITGSNLDEFFAVRMSRLERAVASGTTRRFPDGRTPRRALVDVRRAVVAFQAAQDRLWLRELRPELAAERIRVVSSQECSSRELRALTTRFRHEIEPMLAPVALAAGKSCDIDSLGLNVAALIHDGTGSEGRLRRVAVPDCLPRFLELGSARCVPLEDVILHFLPTIIGPATVETAAVFRITRDANLAVAGDAVDVVRAVEAELRRRPDGAVVRLETRSASSALVAELLRELGVGETQHYESAAPLALRELLELAEANRPELRSPLWEPVTHGAFAGNGSDSLLAEIRRGDILVHHPYDSFDSSVQAFVSAARDPLVEGLKATVYRTGDASPTLASLARAASAEKEAVAFVEVKARFDERRNIDSGRSLERAGVEVVYGVRDLKVHAKLTLLERREPDGIRRYVHLGTGNYHASNACSYEDLSLFTADEDIAADVCAVFDVITGRTRTPALRKLLVAPWSLRRGVLDEIERVSDAAASGGPARVRVKVNSLADPEIVDALYRASRAGATVEVVTRGICVLRPGIRGVSERIRVRSVLGRFLEHSRILVFQTEERTTTWIGSADLMPRNLDHRIEVLAPIEDARVQDQLRGVFDALLRDTAASWELDAVGAWRRVRPPNGERPISAQQLLMARAIRAGAPVIVDAS